MIFYHFNDSCVDTSTLFLGCAQLGPLLFRQLSTLVGPFVWFTTMKAVKFPFLVGIAYLGFAACMCKGEFLLQWHGPSVLLNHIIIVEYPQSFILGHWATV